MNRWRALAVAGWVVVLAYGCSGSGDSTTNSGSSSPSTGGSASGPGGGSATGAPSGGTGGTTGALSGGTGGASSTSTGTAGGCVPGNTQCTDCIDNDGDGLIDGWDPECTGPLDNDESSFKTGIPGDNIDLCKQDCFFDGNSGQGDDGCDWELKCDPANPGAPKCPYDPKAVCAPQSQFCIDFCSKLTPNGCDCFGCCAVTAPDQTVHTVLLGGDCTYETIKDTSLCKPCTQNTQCVNTCEPCEYCLGKTKLPPECTPDGGTSTGTGTGGAGGGTNGCSPGVTPCTPTTPCSVNEYCLTGCCVKIPT